MRLEELLLRRRTTAAIAAGACVSVSLLAWLGYVAVRQWQQSVATLAARQAEEASALFLSSLTRDMRAVQRSVLLSPAIDRFTLRPPYEAIDVVAGAFARYRYPESFFLWRSDSVASSGLFLNRRERRPAWAHAAAGPNRFPLTVDTDASLTRRLLDRIDVDAAQARRFSVFAMTIDGTAYQVVARLFYDDNLRQQLDTVFAFTVNLEWVRQHYFSSLLSDAASTGAAHDNVWLVIRDDRERVVTPGAYSARNTIPVVRRVFPVTFFDPLLIAADPPADLPRESWIVEAKARDDSSVVAAIGAGDRMLMLQALAAVMLVAGFALTLRASRASLRLVDLQSEFVSSVTHEFKTPIATIQAAGETLASGRMDGDGTRREYATYIVQESRRLTRLVDNLLAFSRLQDTGEMLHVEEPVALADLVAGTLQRFALHISDRRFDVTVNIPPDLPPVRGDASAIGLLLDNLVDNVIRHSRAIHRLRVAAAPVHGGRVIVEVTDSGGGIAEDELRAVTRKFYRGRNAGQGGTGLGLAIASRIAAQHGGELTIRSERGVGTTVSVSFAISATAAVPSELLASKTG
jgi:signal transduction histidine kinase